MKIVELIKLKMKEKINYKQIFELNFYNENTFFNKKKKLKGNKEQVN